MQALMRENYAAGIYNIELLNQEILDTLAERGKRNNTYVCILSDHGEMLGDFWDLSPIYEPLGKNSPWQASIGVPMACMGPGIPAGRVVDDPVATIDVAATAMDLQGARIPIDLDSVSMKSLLLGGEVGDHPILSTLNVTAEAVPHTFSTILKRLE